jgi:CBS domain-containing protein
MEGDTKNYDIKDFLDKKVVILPENATVEEAAKAMAQQRVGCVVVKGRQRILGVVTDRDLACQVIAENRSPSTALADVITVEELVFVHEDNHLDDVVDKMIQHGVRRIPVIAHQQHHHSRETCVGIITLDDLITAEAIDIHTVKDVIAPQVRLFGKTRTNRFEKRKQARLQQSLNVFMKSISREMDMDRQEAEPLIVFILKSLVERISYTEANDLISSLPKLLQEELWNVPAGPNRHIDAEYILRHMQVKFGITRAGCERICRSFWIGLELYLLNNECAQILSQLPGDLQLLFVGEVIHKEVRPQRRSHRQESNYQNRN